MAKQFPESHDSIIRDADKIYMQVSKDTKFSKSSSNPLDKRLEVMAYFLATIQTLEEKQTDFQIIKTVCIEIALDYVRPKNRFQKSLKKLPPKLINTKLSSLVLKVMDKKLSKKGHEDGFLAKIITDKKETFGFGYGIDILECGICKLFNKHNAQQYTPILCEVDKITSSLAGLELIRKGTIANGADKCDFRFKKK
ncbi:L-2-amino-thiazoline-4-carboxylic acid hydrolase [Spongiimicrobium sp. 2-473A-2-J]|uniref:L-2-amino-thiazoline-4-carboxylic acid hydrolase n=1 Tax=Eudoraea algarum TaxID=3417568 RepID=UPI003D35B114